jgi:hypothetical protein
MLNPSFERDRRLSSRTLLCINVPSSPSRVDVLRSSLRSPSRVDLQFKAPLLLYFILLFCAFLFFSFLFLSLLFVLSLKNALVFTNLTILGSGVIQWPHVIDWTLRVRPTAPGPSGFLLCTLVVFWY